MCALRVAAFFIHAKGVRAETEVYSHVKRYLLTIFQTEDDYALCSLKETDTDIILF